VRHVIDVPGHEKLRFHVHDYLRFASRILFLVDATNFGQHIRANAEFLYTILADPLVIAYRIPVLIACHKSDVLQAWKSQNMKVALEKEM